MRPERRLFILKIAAAAVAGLYLLDLAVITPATRHWREQGEQLDALRQKVQRGEQLLSREKSVRGKWADMMQANLPAEVSVAENEAFRALARWANESRIMITSVSPQWQNHDEGYRTYECRVSAAGNQQTLARFIYELETDTIPVSLEECEITTRDAHGADLAFTARFSFLRMTEPGGRTR